MLLRTFPRPYQGLYRSLQGFSLKEIAKAPIATAYHSCSTSGLCKTPTSGLVLSRFERIPGRPGEGHGKEGRERQGTLEAPPGSSSPSPGLPLQTLGQPAKMFFPLFIFAK